MDFNYKVPVSSSKRPHFLAANVFRRDDSVSVSLNISPRVCIISMHALENKEKKAQKWHDCIISSEFHKISNPW